MRSDSRVYRLSSALPLAFVILRTSPAFRQPPVQPIIHIPEINQCIFEIAVAESLL
jgi:hypothetical protein